MQGRPARRSGRPSERPCPRKLLTSNPLATWLARSRELGFLGPGPVAGHVAHAEGMARAIGATPAVDVPPTCMLDLGAGGGVPGLVLAGLWPDCPMVLLDSNTRRTDLLRAAVGDLRWEDRVDVVCERAEVAGRDPRLRGCFDLVVARAFGPPATTAECAAPFLRVGGHLAVAEPPAGPAAGDRWPIEGCMVVGLQPLPAPHGPVAVRVLRQAEPCPERFPRRNGLPAKRPLF